jgi:hypothetical protein
MSEPTLTPGSYQPTIYSSYRPVDDYLRYRKGVLREQDVDPAVAMRPLDALLTHLLISIQPQRVHVVDLAADATDGASTALALTHPSVRRVAVRRSETVDRNRPLLHCHLHLSGVAALPEWIEIEDDPGAASEPMEPNVSLVLLTAQRRGEESQIAEQVERWLDVVPRALVLVLGVGVTGSCPVLAALANCCGVDSPLRLLLPREWAPSLVGSALGVVGARNQTAVDEIAFRIGPRFNDLYQTHDLLAQTCRSLLKEVVENEMAESEKMAEERKTLEKIELLEELLADQQQEIEHLQKSMQQLTGSVAFRILDGARRALRKGARGDSRCHWVVQKLRSAVRLFRKADRDDAVASTVAVPIEDSSTNTFSFPKKKS